TNEAERQVRQTIRRLARAQPGRRIIVTGCGADISHAAYAAMPEVAAVVGNADKRDPAAYRVGRNAPFRSVFADDGIAFAPVVSGRSHARAFIAVQTGCDHRCTFCIIPFGRGDSRSAPLAAVVEATARAVDGGHGEVVLTGVDVTSYGHDLPGTPTLGHLVDAILDGVPDLPRLRLSSLDSVEIDDRLFDRITGDPRVMPHVHLSLQAGDDMILKRMKRRHSRADAVALVHRLKSARPDIAIGADLIAGFPTEDDAAAANSLTLIDDCDIVHGHIFPFSPRRGTPAARMPQVDRAIAKARAAALRDASRARRDRWLAAQVGTDITMLVERDGRSGHAPNFASLMLDADAPPGEIIRVRALSVGTGVLAVQRVAP
ncbi:MAG: hypothetical protein RLZZ58_118, partial [Pseudomonadota bacterium]